MSASRNALATTVPSQTPVAIVPTVTRAESPKYPVQLVKTPLVGVPSNGVTRVGEVLNTSSEVPVSLDIMLASSADVVAANASSVSPSRATVPVTA